MKGSNSDEVEALWLLQDSVSTSSIKVLTCMSHLTIFLARSNELGEKTAERGNLARSRWLVTQIAVALCGSNFKRGIGTLG